MNYFELYPGDYLKTTGRLTMLEHGAYLRLLLEYYATEQPLPAEADDLFVIAGAMRSADRDAVLKVADRYFPVGADGLRHNARADDEIAKAQVRINTARENGRLGGRPRKPAGLSTGSKGKPDGFPVGSVEETQTITQRKAPHTPCSKAKAKAEAKAPEPTSSTRLKSLCARDLDAGRACQLMKAAGCVRINPSHPDLLAAIAEGVTPEALADAAREGLGKRNPFAWAIATARGRHADGAQPIESPGGTHATRTSRRPLSASERVARVNAEAELRERTTGGVVVEGGGYALVE